MNIEVKDKVYKVKFGYLVVAKSGLIGEVVDTLGKLNDGSIDNDFSGVMVTLADMLLYGLQKAHADEFGFNFITDEGKDEKFAKVCDLLDDYFDNGGDPLKLFEDLTEELQKNGFLKSVLTTETPEQE